MKRNVVLTLLNIALLGGFFKVVAGHSVAQDPPSADMGYPISLDVGQAVSVCRTGIVICPVRSAICDDTPVATVRGGKDGLQIVGLKPGTTHCSFTSAVSVRAIYKVTVH